MNNSNHLSVNQTTEDDLQEVSNKMRQYVNTESENLLEVIKDKINERPGLFGVLFPGKVKKEHDKLTIQKMKNLFEAREDMLAAYTNTQIELARKAGDKMIEAKVIQYSAENQELAMQKQTELTAFAQLKINDMSANFEESRIPFGARRKRQMIDAEQYKDDDYYFKRLIKNLNKESDVFFDTIEDLLNGFKEAMKRRLNDMN